jgi:hypothetical protein
MSGTHVSDLGEKIESMQKKYLETHGWRYCMWRWYWVWRKDASDASFTCMTVKEALIVEGALESSADYRQTQTPNPT